MSGNSSGNKKTKSLEDIFAVPSDKLRDLRKVIQNLKDFREFFGANVQFPLVVDSNIVLGDILWLVAERRDVAARTNLMEIIDAETIELYAPPRLVCEVEEKIPLLAEQRGLDINEMNEHWQTYKSKIKIVQPDDESVRLLRSGVDPDDADFVALEKEIPAAGTITKDKHIRAMGGNQISINCIVHLRNYSRATVIELNIKVNGFWLAVLSMSAMRGLYLAVKALAGRIKGAPDWFKVALLGGGVLMVCHPGARAKVANSLQTLLGGISDATPVVISLIANAATLMDKNKTEAQMHLARAMKELGGNE
ncbi:PIN domain-containing protein [Pandoraea sp.]|uniref:PIN domain-containing protein n=1 Tax=Pandoraea sp. TaxID=1883445 RepID=UPI0012245AA1|nr:PIN domain-containing protein [Pandoraea sp.]TAL53820.1 MAG: hypothetical protein EPN80_14225 [Pandoraea sp.]TAM17073.1 MAG: hypothetical protein EPN65_12395 [Pandoraea sp.]